MERVLYSDKIEERIDKAECGSVFVVSDFTDLASYETAKKALLRLEKNGKIMRAIRGVYYKPEYSILLQENAESDPDKIADAIARNYNWTIAPSGDYALNILGLSTQVPATWSYVSDGPYRKYVYEKIVIEFKHTTNREISGVSFKTAVIIQALKALGERKVNDSVIDLIAKSIKIEQKEKILSEAQNTTSWIYSAIKEICRKVEMDVQSCKSKSK